MKKIYPSKKAKRRAEAEEGKRKKLQKAKKERRINEATDIEVLAMLMGVRLN